ncbi:MAG: UDP-N-acetylmuramoyl-L-alanine--D-glutamate ligase [Ignavibacteria bacterium]|jgi:UDP-N-acetylmuramoylalanine--D-glutamate ligase|nr:UDP-N-acetylmuramoyl-L-alanine--D-glutamate ligase [Ignavibacteria bacterium]
MNYCILGAARSGLAAARLACAINSISNPNHIVEVRELGDATDFTDAIDEFNANGVRYVFGSDSQTDAEASLALKGCDMLVISPGVPNDAPFILKAQALGISVVSELEFASQHLTNPIIAVTGTNGKTTTTTLITYMLNRAGKKSISAGNIGYPMADVAHSILTKSNDIDEETIIVAEVSSYQLEFIDTFRPKLAIILNVTPDHLKYHKTFENYLQTKIKIAKNQTETDYLVLNADDESLNCKDVADFKHRTGIKSTILQFSLSPVERGIYLQDDRIVNISQHNKEEIMQTTEIRIPGIHNQYNSMASAIAAKVWMLRNEDVRDSLIHFEGVEHRLEYVRTINNVDYVNDSKATNVNATWYALLSYNKPLIWIAGGRGDHNDYSLLDKAVYKHVRSIIALGEEKDAIYDRYAMSIDCTKVDDIYDAVQYAHKIANDGDVVLFTPACKSFDQFLNFEQRGEYYKMAVNQLAMPLN